MTRKASLVALLIILLLIPGCLDQNTRSGSPAELLRGHWKVTAFGETAHDVYIGKDKLRVVSGGTTTLGTYDVASESRRDRSVVVDVRIQTGDIHGTWYFSSDGRIAQLEAVQEKGDFLFSTTKVKWYADAVWIED